MCTCGLQFNLITPTCSVGDATYAVAHIIDVTKHQSASQGDGSLWEIFGDKLRKLPKCANDENFDVRLCFCVLWLKASVGGTVHCRVGLKESAEARHLELARCFSAVATKEF